MFSMRVSKMYPIVLLGVLSWTALWTFKFHFSDWQDPLVNGSLKEAVFQSLPRPIRVIGADLCWITADEYVHFGGSKKHGQKFLAGSYAGNTEILPMLQLAVQLDPTFFEVFQVLCHNLAMYLDRFQEAIGILQTGIQKNPESPRLHELYGTIAYFYYFVNRYTMSVQKNADAAYRYLEAAIASYKSVGSPPPYSPTLSPRFYNMVRSRIFVEKGDLKMALAAWRDSGDPLESSDDLLGIYLAKYARGEAVPPLPEDLPEGKYAKSEFNDPKFLPKPLKKTPDSAHTHEMDSKQDPPEKNMTLPPTSQMNPIVKRLAWQTSIYILGIFFLRIFSMKRSRPST